jgi:hypothetical protein
VAPEKTKFVVLASLIDYLERLSGKQEKRKSRGVRGRKRAAGVSGAGG